MNIKEDLPKKKFLRKACSIGADHVSLRIPWRITQLLSDLFLPNLKYTEHWEIEKLKTNLGFSNKLHLSSKMALSKYGHLGFELP